jgi:hypothetical protein
MLPKKPLPPKGNKLFVLLGALNGFEWNRLLKFAVSPFFTESERFGVFLRALHGDKKQHFEAYKNGFGTMPKQAFLQLLSDTTELVLLFLKMETAVEQPFESVFGLYNTLLEKGLGDFAEKQWLYLHAENQVLALRNADFYYKKYKTESALLEQQNRDIRRAEKANLEPTVAALDTWFLAERLRLTCDALNRSRILQHEYDLADAQALVAWANASRYADEPLVAVYLHILYILQHQQDSENTTVAQHFSTLIFLLKSKAKDFTIKELRGIYIYPQNYCIRQINSGKEAFNIVFFEMMQTMLADKILLDDKGELLPWDYKNIVAAGLRCEDYVWVEDFLHRYNEKLPAGFRRNALNYNLAKLAFAKKDYANVLKNLQIVEYEDLFYALDSRWMLLKTYYHLSEYNAMEAQIDTFRIYLLRHKGISTALQKQYLQLLRFAKRLITSNTPTKAARLAADIQAKPQLPDKKWLLAQVGIYGLEAVKK